MNEYMQGLQADVRGADPNPWSQMLMSAAATNNAWSAEQAQKQMDFQERMSNTAHQREMEDLKAAGLNPVLSAKLGGASTPSGASATADGSIVSSIVSLMDKMLDVQGTSAAAAYNASGGYNETYGYDSGTSGKTIYNNENVDNWKPEQNGPNGTTKMTENGTPLDAATVGKGKFGDAIASFYNGFMGYDNPKQNKAAAAYSVGQTINKATSPALNFKEKSFNNRQEVYKKVGSAIKSGFNNAKEAVSGFGKWLVTGKK